MARVLIVGDGERTLSLARLLADEGILARIVTFDPGRIAAIEDARAEACLGDPDRLATITDALDGATVACWLFGTADRDLGRLQDLHGALLQAFLLEAIDSPLRGFVYEAAGNGPAQLLAHGAEIAHRIALQNSIPLRVLSVDPGDLPSWTAQASAAIWGLLLG